MAKNKISLSAWTVVLSHGILARSKRWRSLVAQEDVAFYKTCLDYCASRFWGCRLLGALPDAMKLWMIEHLVVYGAPQHFVLRKKAIEKLARACVAKNTSQLVVIGSGFDLLAFNMAQAFPDLRCFEIDTPSMARHKAAILQQCYGATPGNFHARGEDLAKVPLHSVVAALPGFSPDSRTLFVAEGLMMYLGEDHVKALFADARQACVSPCSVLFTAIARPPQAKSGFWQKFRNLILGYDKEVFSWCQAPEDMQGFLQARGFTQEYQVGYVELQREWRTGAELSMLGKQNGEYLVYAVSQ